MHADVERFRFEKANHFLRVIQQQGRVLLASEANEQVSILLQQIRQLAIDLTGGSGAPASPDDPTKVGDDFKIVNQGDALLISPGHYWVDGHLCELEDDPVHIDQQPDYPLSDLDKLLAIPALLYLDVWERHTSAAETPDLREIALAGPDSSSRSKLVWQVKRTLGHDWDAVVNALPRLTNGGRLAAKVKRVDQSKLPCAASPDAGYTGAENQLIRVEIHTGGPVGKATFKWAYDNASVAYRVATIDGTKITLEQTPWDCAKGFAVDSCIEVLDDTSLRRGESGKLVRVARVEDLDDYTLTLDGDLSLTEQHMEEGGWAIVRRWDHPKRALKDDGAILVEEGTSWLPLDKGLQIQFSAVNADYRSGNYWTIPLRVVTGDVIWPSDAGAPRSVMPQGIEHHYAPLALIDDAGLQDMRRFIKPSAT
jgi:Family of unknown function (DUF6519)